MCVCVCVYVCVIDVNRGSCLQYKTIQFEIEDFQQGKNCSRMFNLKSKILNKIKFV